MQQEDIPYAYMTIADHLDMVGVELKATYTQTRKVNGDAIQSRVNHTVGSWRSGKFMSLTQRPWSLNNFVLSKVWYKCNSLDLRVSDIASITSKVKTWLYADQLEKPEELVLYKTSAQGGLGMHNVEHKAMSMLIRSFLETAINPKFLHNLYHTSLFRYYVLLHRDLPDPGRPPYYTYTFFQTIREAHEGSGRDVATMSSRDWYLYLVEKHITMEADETGNTNLRPSKVERVNTDNDWVRSWRLVRISVNYQVILFKLWILHIRANPNKVYDTTPNLN